MLVPGAVKRAGYRIPQNGETPAYVEKVMGYLTAAGGRGDKTGIGSRNWRNCRHATDRNNGFGDIAQIHGGRKTPKTFLGWMQTGTHTETIDGGTGRKTKKLRLWIMPL